MVENDEHPRETTLESLSKLRTCFKTDGTVTPGNCSSINDGKYREVLPFSLVF